MELLFALGLGQPDGALAFFPLAALFEELDALEALEDRAFSGGGTGGFERIVLGHGGFLGLRGRETTGEIPAWQGRKGVEVGTRW